MKWFRELNLKYAWFLKRCTHVHLSGKKNHNGISDRERIFRSNPRQRVGAILR